jgi:hypothetical protein
MHALMHIGHEFVEMCATLCGEGDRVEEEVHQHGLAAADGPMNEKAPLRRRCFPREEAADAGMRTRGAAFKGARKIRKPVEQVALRRIVLDGAGPDKGKVVQTDRIVAARRGGRIDDHAVRLSRA